MTKLLQKYLVLILLFLMTTAYSTPMSTCKTGEPISNSVIEYYANSALNSIFSFNFIDYKEKIPSFNEYLNEDAWKEYLRVINDSHLSDDLIKEKLLVNAYFKTPAQVVNQNGKVWQVKAPIVINLQSATEYRNVRITVTLDIVRDLGEPPNCGLRISHIQFIPSPNKTASSEINFNYPYIPYKPSGENKLPLISNDLKQPGLDDKSLILAVNLWLLKQKNIDLAHFDHPLIISQKGILDNRYAWRLDGPDQKKILVRRTLNNPEGIEIQMEHGEAANNKNHISLPNTFDDKNKVYSVKYPLKWIYQIKSPISVWFTPPENSDAPYTLIGINVFSDKLPELLDFLTSGGKKYKGLARDFFQQINI